MPSTEQGEHTRSWTKGINLLLLVLLCGRQQQRGPAADSVYPRLLACSISVARTGARFSSAVELHYHQKGTGMEEVENPQQSPVLSALPDFQPWSVPPAFSTQLSSGLDSSVLCFICNLEVANGCWLEARASASRLAQFFFERQEVRLIK